jgi:hypothetical protein
MRFANVVVDDFLCRLFFACHPEVRFIGAKDRSRFAARNELQQKGASFFAEITAGKMPARGCSVADFVAATFRWPASITRRSKQLSN